MGANSWVNAAFGGGADARWDGELRAGTKPTPVTRFLVDKVGLAPGSVFRGYADDAYSRVTGVELVDRVIATWSRNASLTGNGMKYFGWNTQGIPTVSEYSP